MNPNTHKLQALGQRLWLDNISRELLDSGRLAHYIEDLSITGLTSNPTIFGQALGDSDRYDEAIRACAAQGLSSEDTFFELALQDLRRAAALLRPVFDATQGVDGWVSLELSPLLARDTAGSILAAARTRERAGIPNLMVKIPGTPEGLPAIEQSVFDGIPVNVTLLFSREHYLAAADAYLRGIERRLDAGLAAKVASVASLFVSRWDAGVKQEITPSLRNRLGIVMAMRTYRAYRELLASPRWTRLAAAGAQPQRLLWASTASKDPAAPDTLYVRALESVDTIDTLPEKTLLAFADHGKVGWALPSDGGYAEAVLAEFRREGVDDEALAERLQRDGVDRFVTSWEALLSSIRAKATAAPAGAAA